MKPKPSRSVPGRFLLSYKRFPASLNFVTITSTLNGYLQPHPCGIMKSFSRGMDRSTVWRLASQQREIPNPRSLDLLGPRNDIILKYCDSAEAMWKTSGSPFGNSTQRRERETN